MDLIAVTGPNWDGWFSSLFGLLFIGIVLYSQAIPQGDRRWWALVVMSAALVIAGLQADSLLLRMVLLDAAAFAAVALVWTQGGRAAGAARTYLALLIPAVGCIGAGLLLSGGFGAVEGAVPPAYPLDKLAVALFLVGFGLKLAFVPFYFWLPAVAESASPMTTALIVSVVDIAAFGELAALRQTAPWVFDNYAALWLAMALLSMFGGALLAMAQRDLKRMLAFSTIDDMGYLLLGVVAGPGVGLAGALLAGMSHALCKVLLFGAVGVAEKQTGQAITLDTFGLAARFPASGVAFIVGALGMIGVPPLFGFAGRWRLYLAGTQYGGPALAMAMALATALALFYYVRAIHRVWLGRPPEPAGTHEPRLAAGALAVLSALAVLLGVFPGLVS